MSSSVSSLNSLAKVLLRIFLPISSFPFLIIYIYPLLSNKVLDVIKIIATFLDFFLLRNPGSSSEIHAWAVPFLLPLLSSSSVGYLFSSPPHVWPAGHRREGVVPRCLRWVLGGVVFFWNSGWLQTLDCRHCYANWGWCLGLGLVISYELDLLIEFSCTWCTKGHVCS